MKKTLLFLVGVFYNALDWGIESPQEFRDRLLRESGDRDRNDVINLFEGYFWN